MIIDIHAHIGDFVKIIMKEDEIIQSMDKYGIDFTLVSNGGGVEVDHDQVPIPLNEQISQKELNERVIKFARKYPNRIGVLLWIKPMTEKCDNDFEQQIIDNRDIIYGIKVHPYHSKLSFGSKKVEPYIKMAEKYNLPVVTHTANDYESSPRVVYEVALKYPKVNIVMYHMGLATDNNEAIELISRLPNLYGDTCWVEYKKALDAIEKCGIDKILFGSDNPINGVDTYNDDVFYNPYFHELKSILSKEDYDKLMYKNAEKLFGIDLKKIV